MAILDRVNTPEDVKKLNSKELKQLTKEIREFLVDNVMHSGGHLASNLGVVELTLALIKSFDFPKDKIIFDVGHQCYVYKMLTGRKDRFCTLRHLGGISGFPKKSESEYDFFDVGHAGTSISAAVGMARARDLVGADEHIIAFIGDGALTSGMSFEALNDVGLRKTKLIIILNDNAMSIHKNVGGLSMHLTKLRFNPKYVSTKNNIQGFLNKFGKCGKSLGKLLQKIKNKIKYAAIAQPLFEQLGISYMGIIDGNNIEDVTAALEKAKNTDGPVIIHTYTKKGLGYRDAEDNPSKFHGVSSETSRISRSDISYDAAFSSIICSMAENDPSIVAITAAMASGCGLTEFANKFPDRFFDVGIAEEHAVTMAAGMANKGITPVVCLYSTFLQRSYDQLVHDVCLQNLHVVFAIGHAGLTGEDGETHNGLLDLSMLCHMPNMTVLSPSDYDQFKEMLNYAAKECTGPVCVRYPKCSVPFNDNKITDVTKGTVVKKGEDILILSCGRMVYTAVDAAKLLEKDGISACVVNLGQIKPFDKEIVLENLSGKRLFVTIEDNVTDGGMGQYVASHINCTIPKLHLGFDTCFVPHGKQDELFKLYSLDVDGVYQRILKQYNAQRNDV